MSTSAVLPDPRDNTPRLVLSTAPLCLSVPHAVRSALRWAWLPAPFSWAPRCSPLSPRPVTSPPNYAAPSGEEGQARRAWSAPFIPRCSLLAHTRCHRAETSEIRDQTCESIVSSFLCFTSWNLLFFRFFILVIFTTLGCIEGLGFNSECLRVCGNFISIVCRER